MDRFRWSAAGIAVMFALAGCRENMDESHTYTEPAQLPEKHRPLEVPVDTDDSANAAPPTIPPTPEMAPGKPTSPDVTETVPSGNVETAISPTPARSAVETLVELAYRVPPPPPKAIPLSKAVAAFPVREMKLLIPEKSFSQERGALRLTFDDVDLLKILNVEPVPDDIEKSLPDWLRELSGQRVRIRGWMFPPPFEEGLEQFAFVRDNEICCFGREAKVYDKFGVSLKPGTTTRYIEGRPFDVAGTMHVKSKFLRDKLMYLYTISDAEVIDR